LPLVSFLNRKRIGSFGLGDFFRAIVFCFLALQRYEKKQ